MLKHLVWRSFTCMVVLLLSMQSTLGEVINISIVSYSKNGVTITCYHGFDQVKKQCICTDKQVRDSKGECKAKPQMTTITSTIDVQNLHLVNYLNLLKGKRGNVTAIVKSISNSQQNGYYYGEVIKNTTSIDQFGNVTSKAVHQYTPNLTDLQEVINRTQEILLKLVEPKSETPKQKSEQILPAPPLTIVDTKSTAVNQKSVNNACPLGYVKFQGRCIINYLPISVYSPLSSLDKNINGAFIKY